MKAIATVLAALLLLLTGCPANAQANEAPDEDYAKATRLVAEAQQRFTDQFDKTVLAQERSVIGLAPEGTTMTRYSIGGKTVAFVFEHCRSTGNALHMYYLLKNGQVYIEALETYYATQSFSPESRLDPYRYEFGKFLLAGEKTLYISDDRKSLTTSDRSFLAWRDCERIFEETPEQPE